MMNRFSVAVFGLLLGGAASLAAEDLAPGVLYPKITGDWSPYPGTKGVTGKPGPLELSPGHFYILEKTPKKDETGLYHTTHPADFDLASTQVNTKAMHMVAEFPLTQVRLVQEEDQWFVTGHKAGTDGLQKAPVTWTEIAPVAARQPDAAVTRVALFDDYGSFGKGIPRCTEQLGNVKGVALTLVKPSLIREGGLKDFDVVIFTGGSGGKQAGTLGVVGREQVRRFIEAGGGYIGICAGNYLACDGFSWGVKILDAKTKSNRWARGEGQLKVEFTPKGREILGMPEGLMDIKYANGPVFNPAGDDAIGDFETLAFFRTELAENGSPVGAQVDSPAMVIGSYGQGRVLCSSPHPEQQDGMEHFIVKAVEWAAGK